MIFYYSHSILLSTHAVSSHVFFRYGCAHARDLVRTFYEHPSWKRVPCRHCSRYAPQRQTTKKIRCIDTSSYNYLWSTYFTK